MASVTVYYCPDLRLYRYVLKADQEENNVDSKFDEAELVDAIGAFTAAGQKETAEFMSWATGLGRVNPHKIVCFESGSDKLEIFEPAHYWKIEDAKVAAAEAADAAESSNTHDIDVEPEDVDRGVVLTDVAGDMVKTPKKSSKKDAKKGE